MTTVARTLCALCLALAPLPLAAQEGDAFVLSPGMIRIRATAELTRFDALFADGGSRPLGSELLTPLTAQSLAPLLPLQAELGRFLDAAGSPLAADAQTFRLGTLELAAAADTRVVPLSLAVGILPRVELGLSLPLLREDVLYTRFALAGGTLGGNLDPEGNASLLARFGEEWGALGRSSVLPTDSSTLGRELQRLVQAAFPDEALELPDSAADIALLNALLADELGLAPLAPRTSPWRAGDLELSARFQFLSTLGAAPVPTDSGALHYRAAISASARLPTGTEPDSVWLVGSRPDVGQTGFGIGLDGDVFVGERWWATASLHHSRRSEVEVLRRVADPDAPLALPGRPREVRWTPPALTTLRLAPRFRLTDAISVGAQYSLSRRGDSSYEVVGESGDGALLSSSGGVSQTAGVGLRYSTLPSTWGGSGGLPVEVALSFERVLTGPGGQPEASRLSLQASLHRRLWGGDPR